MAMHDCRECGKRISDEAGSCPHCGAPVRGNLLKAQYGKESVPPILKLIFGAIVIGGIIHYCSNQEPVPEKTPEEKCNDTTSAYFMSQEFVKKKLESPSTADFPYSKASGVETINVSQCTHVVRAYVDSQNTFGATVRTKYYVKLHNDLGTDMWHVDDITLWKQ